MARGRRESVIVLVDPKGKKQEFGLQHAERLLDMGSELNGGWKIDPASNYYYDEENGIRLKANKGNSAKA